MLRAFSISKSGMNSNQLKLDTISSNIANIGTNSYKKQNINFKDLMTENLNRKGVPISENSINGTGVKTSYITRNIQQGTLKQTSRQLDLAIDGEGYFKVVDGEGKEYYTRDGSFFIDSNNDIVDHKGNKLEIKFIDETYKNKLTHNNFSINKDGLVHITEDETTIEIGRISTYDAIGNTSFQSVGDNLYIPTEQAEIFETNDRDILQGYLENSNVDLAEEFTEMILTQRAFQLSSKGLQTADEMWGMVNNLRN